MTGEQLYFSKIQCNPCGKHQGRDWNPYATHQTIWRFFADDPNRKRDFLYRYDIESGLPRYYALSRRRPADTDPGWMVEPKSFSPRIGNGDVLAFSLRANPVKSVKTRGVSRSKRHDVIMWKKRALGADWNSRFTEAELLQTEGIAWLRARASANGFSIGDHSVRAEAYRQHRFQKKRRCVSISSLDYTGLLKVTDAVLFKHALFNGIGAAKGFGCGLLLVKRV